MFPRGSMISSRVRPADKISMLNYANKKNDKNFNAVNRDYVGE
jgi:hypothetical protein